MDIHIENCNNIMAADITIAENKMNIFFGRNGSGKSTIAKAISDYSKGNDLEELRPYGLTVKDKQPLVKGNIGSNVMVFNDEYVNTYVYQKNSVLTNAFDILVRTPEYDAAKEAVDKELYNLKTVILDDDETIKLIDQLQLFLGKIKVGGNQHIDKRSAKGILDGKGAYFNPPKELESMRPFFEDEGIIKWATWRIQGFEQFGKKGLCPYCTVNDDENTQERNRVFSENFDKGSLETSNLILNFLDELSEYIDAEKISQLKSFFGLEGNSSSLETHLMKLNTEAKYLFNQLTKIRDFNGSKVNKDDIQELERMLFEMKIDFLAIDSYFTTEYSIEHLSAINEKIDDLISSVGKLKGEIAKYNKYLNDIIKDRTEDINEFLKLAGFKYHFDVKLDGEDNASAILEYILPDDTFKGLDAPNEHLSWGERHAFALIMFMFDAISKNADIVVLDDPISSFDRNKKYAIINRLFKTGNRDSSLYQRTVLLLTHDFEPVIDYVQTQSGKQDKQTICAFYIENKGGLIKLTEIVKNIDMLSSVVLLKELAKDNNMYIAARIGCLRKYLEHQYVNPREDSHAYNILSSLMHGRSKATVDNEGKDELSDKDIEDGTNYIKNFISDFDYGSLLELCSLPNLLKAYGKPDISSYERIMILRFYIERDEEARKRLKEYNDVLRKYVDETFHIENDYLYSLDVRKFDIVPEEYYKYAEQFVAKEIESFNQ